MGARDAGVGGRQLPLDLASEPGYGVEDFFISASNEAAFAAIARWPEWPDAVLVLTGPPGCGKSHLGAIWAKRAQARAVAAAAIGDLGPDALAAPEPMLIENLERLEPAAQPQLFHLVNAAREQRASMLLTANRPVDALALDLPDLLSRLRLAPSVAIGPPDDALMRMVLAKLMADRQLMVDIRLIDYAALRLDASLEAARSFVERLDKEALARKSRITRQMAAQVLGVMIDEDTELFVEDADQGPT